MKLNDLRREAELLSPEEDEPERHTHRPRPVRISTIAATAMASRMTLVTRRGVHFEHVAGLKIENWPDGWNC